MVLKITQKLSPFRAYIETYYESDDTFRDIYNDYLTYYEAHQFWTQSRADEAPARRNEYAELVGELEQELIQMVNQKATS